MKIRSQRNQLIDMVGKATTTVRMPTGSYQILAHTKDKVEGAILGEYSTEEKTVRVLCAIQVAAQHPEKIRIFNMPSDAEVVLRKNTRPKYKNWTCTVKKSYRW